MTAIQIISLIYFLFVCIHLNASGAAGIILGGFGIYATLTNQPHLAAIDMMIIMAFHAIVKVSFMYNWKPGKERNRSLLHVGLALAMLLLYYTADLIPLSYLTEPPFKY